MKVKGTSGGSVSVATGTSGGADVSTADGVEVVGGKEDGTAVVGDKDDGNGVDGNGEGGGVGVDLKMCGTCSTPGSTAVCVTSAR